jgi:heme A synthase
MTVRHMRLAVGLFFLVAGVALLALRFGAPDAAARLNSPMRLLIGALLALVLGGVNLAKWYAGVLAFDRAATPVRRPLEPDPTAGSEPEYLPEFDFGKKDDRSR